MANGLRVIPQAIGLREAPGFNGAYQTLGTPLAFACCLVKFINNTTSALTISWDGVTDHDFIPANSFSLYDFGSDAGSTRGLYAAQGTQFWVKGSVGTGSVYLVAFHTSEY